MKYSVYTIFAVLLFLSANLYGQKPIISQVFYDTPLYENGYRNKTDTAHHNGEFIEIFNPSDESLNLSGWQLRGTEYWEVFTFPSHAAISPREYMLVGYNHPKTVNSFHLSYLFPELEEEERYGYGFFYQSSIMLHNAGEDLRLIDPDGQVVDRMTYGTFSNFSDLYARNSEPTVVKIEYCKSLHRINISRDFNQNAFFKREDWTYGKVMPLKNPDRPPLTEPNLSTSIDQNYLYIRTMTNESGTEFLDEVCFFDGLGRQIQTVQKGVTPSRKDLVSIKEYDSLGRENNSWLPVNIERTGSREYVDITTVKQTVLSSELYDRDTNPYTKTVYEESPLSRVIKQYGVGEEWHKQYGADSRPIKTDYLTNRGTTGELSCIFFKVNGYGLKTALTRNGYYADGELFVTRIINEDTNTSYEFKDKLGKTILTRQICEGSVHDTYYAYDEFENLCYVLPPLVVDKMSNATVYADNNPVMMQYAYIYKYDNRKRCIEKSLPGTTKNINNIYEGRIFYVYDWADRPIFSQNGEQRLKGEWFFSIPDDVGRTVVTGLCKRNANGEEIRPENFNFSIVKAQFSPTGLYKGYNFMMDDNPLVLDSVVIHTVNYYDNYKFRNIREVNEKNLAFDSTKDTKYNKRYGTDGSIYQSKGQLTGSISAVFDSTDTVNYLYLAMYYDNRHRLIQSQSTNHLEGKESEYVVYNFTGQPTEKLNVHTAREKDDISEHYIFTYDHAGRLLESKVNNSIYGVSSYIPIKKNTYDELGRVKTKEAGVSYSSPTEYAYDVRSRLVNQKDYFGHYDDNLSLIQQLTYTYGGNIKKYVRDGDAYNYVYDGLARIKDAVYTGNSGHNYSAYYSYDKQGNLLTIKRYGDQVRNRFMLVDDLKMSYIGNQLTYVKDDGVEVNIKESSDFKDYADVPNGEYAYNLNGAMTMDLNKGIQNIRYNSLNLPVFMTVKHPKANGTIGYTYSANGTKLRTIHKEEPYLRNIPLMGTAVYQSSASEITVTDYVGNKIYKNGVLKRFNYGDIYIESGGIYSYLKDYLGNNIAVRNDEGDSELIESSGYYPFGMSQAKYKFHSIVEQPYKYNGKEIDTHFQLNTYDYSARYMDPPTGRFTTMDPMMEKYYSVSPYAYCANNPINFIDPTGREIRLWTTYYKGTKRYRGVKDFSELNSAMQDALTAFMTSEMGQGFLSNYVEGTQTIGGIELKGDAKKGQILDIMFEEGALRIRPHGAGVERGTTDTEIENKGFILKIKIDPYLSAEEMALVLGHEAFLHGLSRTKILRENFKPDMTDMEKLVLKGKYPSAHEEHENHSLGRGEGANIFARFMNYLKGWFGRNEEIMDAIKEEKESNDENVKYGF